MNKTWTIVNGVLTYNYCPECWKKNPWRKYCTDCWESLESAYTPTLTYPKTVTTLPYINANPITWKTTTWSTLQNATLTVSDTLNTVVSPKSCGEKPTFHSWWALEYAFDYEAYQKSLPQTNCTHPDD